MTVNSNGAEAAADGGELAAGQNQQGTRRVPVRSAVGGLYSSGLTNSDSWQDVPAEAADGWDERIWHCGPIPHMGPPNYPGAG